MALQFIISVAIAIDEMRRTFAELDAITWVDRIIDEVYHSSFGERDYLVAPSKQALVSLGDNSVVSAAKEFAAINAAWVNGQFNELCSAPISLIEERDKKLRCLFDLARSVYASHQFLAGSRQSERLHFRRNDDTKLISISHLTSLRSQSLAFPYLHVSELQFYSWIWRETAKAQDRLGQTVLSAFLEVLYKYPVDHWPSYAWYWDTIVHKAVCFSYVLLG
jgi:hypothetical protein